VKAPIVISKLLCPIIYREGQPGTPPGMHNLMHYPHKLILEDSQWLSQLKFIVLMISE